MLVLPKQGWVRGDLNGKRTEVDFDRPNATVKGKSNGDSVSLTSAEDRVQGSANGKAVDLARDWKPEHVHLQGTANGAPLQLDVDYTTHTAKGQVSQKNVDLRFDDSQGIIQGSYGNQSVDLHLENNGRLHGGLNGQNVEAEMINLQLGDFLENFYVFSGR